MQRYPWLVVITAVEAYMGNPDDPLIWRFLSSAETASDAIAETRRNLKLPANTKIEAVSR